MVVLVLAKLAGATTFDLPRTIWLLPVLIWDDVAVGLGLWIFDRVVRRPGVTRTIYWAAVVWAAVNVPVVRALGSTLTINMIGAAGGALSDSIGHYLTVVNIATMTTILALAALLPTWIGRRAHWIRRGGVAIALILAATGYFERDRVDLQGRERNAFQTMVRTLLPRVAGRGDVLDWRQSRETRRVIDLSSWEASARGRNVVLIVVESTAAQYLKSYGASQDPTPILSAFTETGLRFERTFTVYPESIKGLFATLCSRSPGFDVAAEVHAKSPCSSLVRELAAHGYRTGLFHSGRFAYLGMDAIVRSQAFDVAEDAGSIGGLIESSFGVEDRATVKRALAWIDQPRDGKPFFLTYLPTSGHHPYASVEPGPFTEPGDFGAYLNALYDGDRALGSLIEGLRARDLERRTLFVVVGDHGEAFGQHPGNFGHTLAIFDENVRVPLFIVAPGANRTAQSVPDVASTIDIAPTILDLVGLHVPRDYEGVSLLASIPRASLFFTDYSVGLAGIQDGCWKQQLDIENGRSKLFDTCSDPREQHDRAAEFAERVRAGEATLRGWVSNAKHRVTDVP